MFSDVVSERVMNLGEQMCSITTYSMLYPVSPTACGLKDIWDSLSDGDREEFVDRYSDLATAISLMCGDDDDEKKGKGQPGTSQNSTTTEHKQ
jgi:hypothetical protein